MVYTQQGSTYRILIYSHGKRLCCERHIDFQTLRIRLSLYYRLNETNLCKIELGKILSLLRGVANISLGQNMIPFVAICPLPMYFQIPKEKGDVSYLHL
jgi:hypothetical protein